MNRHITPLVVTLNPSKHLKYFVLSLYTLAALASLLNTLIISTQLFLLCLLVVCAYQDYQNLSTVQLTIRHSDACGWEFLEHNELIPVEILKSSVITTLAIFLHSKKRESQLRPVNTLFSAWHYPDKTILIVHDALNADDYRRLIARLKITASG